MPRWHGLHESALQQPWNQVHLRLDNKSPQGEVGLRRFIPAERVHHRVQRSLSRQKAIGKRNIQKRYSTVSSGPLASYVLSE